MDMCGWTLVYVCVCVCKVHIENRHEVTDPVSGLGGLVPSRVQRLKGLVRSL